MQISYSLEDVTCFGLLNHFNNLDRIARRTSPCATILLAIREGLFSMPGSAPNKTVKTGAETEWPGTETF